MPVPASDLFTLAGDGSAYGGLSAALDAINAQYKSQNEALLDELQESIKDYRGGLPLGCACPGFRLPANRHGL